jgi:hypothetical protein
MCLGPRVNDPKSMSNTVGDHVPLKGVAFVAPSFTRRRWRLEWRGETTSHAKQMSESATVTTHLSSLPSLGAILRSSSNAVRTRGEPGTTYTVTAHGRNF